MLQKRNHRSYAPYPVELPVQYRIPGGNPIAGHGHTVTIGRGMVCFRGDRPLPVNRKIELAVDWPAALPDGAKLNVWMTGTIARCEPDAVEVRVETYEFKTRRAPRSGSAPPLKRRLGARAMSGGAA